MTCLDQDVFVKHLVTHYGRTFYLRLTTPLQDPPTDISVASADFASILPSLPVVCRQLVGAAAVGLAKQKKGKKALPPSVALEVRDGSCCLAVNWEGDVERIVSSSALHISCEDGRVLMQLGVRNGEEAEGACDLPSMKLDGCDLHMQAFAQLLES